LVPAKLFVGLLYRDEETYMVALDRMVEKFGKIETKSNPFNFDFTEYYFKEMGRPLIKRFIIFERIIDRGELASIKKYTNNLEKEFAVNGKRRINIDPGYITKANLVLATTKEFPHRIYLGEGIYAEVTLTFKKNGCNYFEWTYQDFKTPWVCGFFLKARKKLL
jgi:hypothetical protein